MSRRTAITALSALFERNGYVRSGPNGSHRGYELRFCVFTLAEVNRVLRDLDELGIASGTPFEKGRMLRIPVYGKRQVEALLDLIGPERKAAAGLP